MNNMIEGYVDFHTHILPQMDDGATSVQESESMLRSLANQGVEAVCLTPHFYPYRESIESFVERREKSFAQLEPLAEEAGVSVVPASETFLHDYLFHAEDISPLCVKDNEGNSYLLTELPVDSELTGHTEARILRLIDTYCVTPVLAHIERCPKLFKDKRQMNRLMDMGCLMQINLESLDKDFFLRSRILRYIENGMVHVVGTDAHHMQTRAPEYSKGIHTIQKFLGSAAVDRLNGNARQILSVCRIREVKGHAS
jgi:protein-tyrosine phosphatase